MYKISEKERYVFIRGFLIASVFVFPVYAPLLSPYNCEVESAYIFLALAVHTEHILAHKNAVLTNEKEQSIEMCFLWEDTTCKPIVWSTLKDICLAHVYIKKVKQQHCLMPKKRALCEPALRLSQN